MNGEATEREVEERFKMVKGLYGDRLDDEQLEAVRQGIEDIVAASQTLRAVSLENSDEPYSVFTPYRAEG